MLQVVAVYLKDKDRFLLAQRPAEKARGLQWEFVGGKIEPGETGEEALRRECREELGIAVTVGQQVAQTVYAYPDVEVCLTVYEAPLQGQAPQLLEHLAFAWVTPDEADRYDLCPADRQITEQLKKRKEV